MMDCILKHFQMYVKHSHSTPPTKALKILHHGPLNNFLLCCYPVLFLIVSQDHSPVVSVIFHTFLTMPEFAISDSIGVAY